MPVLLTGEHTITDIWVEVVKFTDAKGVNKWECKVCQNKFCGHNATKVGFHLARVSGHGIAPCDGEIDPALLVAYTKYAEGILRRGDARARSRDFFETQQADEQTEVATDVSAGASRPSASRDAGQLTIVAGFSATTNTQLSTAIADMIFNNGLSHHLR